MMKEKSKTKGNSKELQDCTFEEAMRKIATTSKVDVEKAIAAEKKKDRKTRP